MTMIYPPSSSASSRVLVGRRRGFQPARGAPRRATALCGQRCEREARGSWPAQAMRGAPPAPAELCRRASERFTRALSASTCRREPPGVGWTARAILTMHVGADDDAYVVKQRSR